MHFLAAWEVLREEVCRIDVAADFPEFDTPVSDPLLDPETSGIDVSQLATSLASAYSHRGG